jgi:hypothetical protein
LSNKNHSGLTPFAHCPKEGKDVAEIFPLRFRADVNEEQFVIRNAEPASHFPASSVREERALNATRHNAHDLLLFLKSTTELLGQGSAYRNYGIRFLNCSFILFSAFPERTHEQFGIIAPALSSQAQYCLIIACAPCVEHYSTSKPFCEMGRVQGRFRSPTMKNRVLAVNPCGAKIGLEESRGRKPAHPTDIRTDGDIRPRPHSAKLAKSLTAPATEGYAGRFEKDYSCPHTAHRSREHFGGRDYLGRHNAGEHFVEDDEEQIH